MSKLKILGTGAAEGIPALFCQCELCMEARNRGGKNIRTRTSMMIGDKFKIDFPPDSNLHILKYGLDLGKLDYLLISHCHADHFDVEELENYSKTAAHIKRAKPLKLYFSQACYDHLIKTVTCFNNLENINPIEIEILEPYKRYETEELYFTPILVQHAPNQQCFNFFIEMKDGKNILYGMDAKKYPVESILFIKKCNIDICICDATHLYEPCGVHMYYNDVRAFQDFLKDNGILNENSKFIVNHFSHNGNNSQNGGNLQMLHENLEKIYGKSGILVAYDGMEIDI